MSMVSNPNSGAASNASLINSATVLRCFAVSYSNTLTD